MKGCCDSTAWWGLSLPVRLADLSKRACPTELLLLRMPGPRTVFTRALPCIHAESYSLFSNNCNNFSDELAQLLCGCGIPDHIRGGAAGAWASKRVQVGGGCLASKGVQVGGCTVQAVLLRGLLMGAVLPSCAAGLPVLWPRCLCKRSPAGVPLNACLHSPPTLLFSATIGPIAGLPAEVLSTPFGQMIAPLLSGLEQQMRGMRAQAYRPHIEAAAAAAQTAAPTAAPAPSPSVPAAALAAAPAPSPTAAAEAEAPAVQAAVPGAGEAGGAAAAEEEGAGLRSAEVEIEAAVAAGMIQEAEQALGSLELQPAAAAAAAAAAGQPAAVAGEPTAAGAVPPAAPTEAAASTKLATELAVDAEFKRLVGAGMAEHEAQALALEAVAAAAGAATDNPVQHGQGAGGMM